MDSLNELHSYRSVPLSEVLQVLDPGAQELKAEIDDFPDLMNWRRVPDQYLDVMWETLGLPRIVGLSFDDKRAVMQALTVATKFKGSEHALRLVLRALWRFSRFEEVYQGIYDDAVEQSLVTQSSDWPAALITLNRDVEELLRIMIYVELTIDDAREYGKMQATQYRELIDQIRDDSGYDNTLRTYRPGFDATPSTLLGTSQYDATQLLAGTDVLYGSSTAFLNPDSQDLLDALVWNVYPDLKVKQTKEVLHHFIPLITHVRYTILGYTNEVDVTSGYVDEDMLSGLSIGTESMVFNMLGEGSLDMETQVVDEFTYTTDNTFNRDSPAWA